MINIILNKYNFFKLYNNKFNNLKKYNIIKY